MNQIERLFKNLKIFIEAGELDNEFAVFAAENPDCDSISELNQLMEDEISYWPDYMDEEARP